MVYEITCPHCQQELEADSQWEGELLECPFCAGEFLVPKTARVSSIRLPAQRGNPLATASLVLGILSILLPPLAVPTIICGHIARSKARTRGGAGSEPALVGLVLGYVAIVIAVAFYVACMALMASLELAGERARRITCNGRLNQVGKALRIYSSDFGGHFPPGDGADGLRVLLECGYLKSPDLLVCPSTGTRPARDAASFGEENCDYVYEGGHTEAEPGDTTPLAWDRSGNHKNMGNILYVDGHVKGFAGPDWRKNLRRK